tara:strand:+ start:21 stop:338 length:318 start_codon:yes stop_codon:yes gene_type:complete
MDNGWLLLIALSLAVILGVMLRNRFLGPETPIRRWFDIRVAPTGGKVAKVFFYLTLVVWLVIWITADEDGRTRFERQFQSLMKSVEQGMDTPAADAPAPAPEPRP